MARSYNDWLLEAKAYKNSLDASSTGQDAIYYRGKYLRCLKKAYNLNPSGSLPSSITGYGFTVSLNNEINTQLTNHHNQINRSIRENKRQPNHSISQEFALKIKRLATSLSQRNAKNSIKASLGLAGTIAKVPILAASKVLSAVGPLAVTIFALPFAALEGAFNAVNVYDGSVSSGKESQVVNKISDGLSNVIKSVSNSINRRVGRM